MSNEPIRSIGIAFSGGGLRAALFHLGVVRFLSETNLLNKTKRICSVSGGSVLSAHLVLHWEDYLKSNNECNESADPFYSATRPLINFASADVRGKILRRFFLYVPGRVLGFFSDRRAFRWSNTGRLQGFYDRLLYGNGELKDLAGTGVNPRPHLYLLSTNLTKLDLCYFDDQIFCPAVFADPRPSDVPAQTTRIAYAVAASSCFPGFFGPLEVNEDTFRTSLARLGIERQQIADGGVFDNLGVRMLRNLNENLEPCDLNIISDAGRSHTWEPKLKFPHVFSTPLRASDVLMSRVGQLERQGAVKMASQDEYQFVTIAPFCGNLAAQYDGSVLDQDSRTVRTIVNLHRVCYELLPHLRTDFDRFSQLETVALVQHGYLSARASLWPYRERLGIKDETFFQPPWHPISGQHEELHVDQKVADKLKEGRNRIWGLWRLVADPLACLPMVTAIAILTILTLIGNHAYREHLAAREERILNSGTVSSAHSIRRHIIDVLRGRRKPDGFWGRFNAAETWTTCQTIGALCQAPEVKEDHLAEYVSMLTNRFHSYDFDVGSSAWTSDTFQTDGELTNHFRGVPHSVPALWFLNALSLIKAKDDTAPSRPNQKELLYAFTKLQKVVSRFQGAGGGWRMYLDGSPEECNAFSTAYALLGMLEAKKAGLNLFAASSQSDKAIGDSVEWLRQHFIVTANGNAGWNEDNDSKTPIRPGLTFQVWTAVLRADEAGFHAEPKFLDFAGSFLKMYSKAHPTDSADEVDVGQLRSRPVHFAVVSWRIACCTEYVAFLKRQGAAHTVCLSYERILHDLVADLELPNSEGEPNTYLFALNLYALGKVGDLMPR